MGKKTVIVESPTKAKTIGRYLGGEFNVVSTVGHIRDLPKSSLGVDPEHDFAPDYQIITGKAKTIKTIKDAIKDADEIYLAPDPDREGEAIAWHVAEILRRPVKRIEFHEITRTAVLRAIAHPREIDYDRVNAQQARRVLDRLVGYQISPLMWRKIKPGLSAGRVQSVAVRLICEREEEIRAFNAQEYWSFDGKFHGGGEDFIASLVRIGDQRLARPGDEHREENIVQASKERTVSSEQEATELVADMRKQTYAVGETQTRSHIRRPQPPFTTSALQQDATRRLGWTARRAMSVAQQLYEGIDLGSGAEGLITYMRTDSVRVADDAVQAARGAIEARFGKDYVPGSPNEYKSKANAQEAHEAIRPTDASRNPDVIQRYLSADQLKLYRLIYERFLASQMKPAEFETTSFEVNGGPYVFRASATRTKFRGFLAAYGEEREAAQTSVPKVAAGSACKLLDVASEQHFTKPPARYTDATLIKSLEENGIGRPSTYAPIIDTILNRGYVVRVARHFEPTEWGFVTTEMLTHYFPDIVDIGFTRDMEERLDSIEEGKNDWRDVLRGFYGPFKERLDTAAGEKKYFKAKPQETEHRCEKCGSVMVLRHGKFGRFLSCSAYPECSNIKNLDDKGNIVDRPVTEAGQELERPCPKCGGVLSVKMSRWGTKFVGCKNYPKCDYTSELQTQCPKCGQDLVRKKLQNRRVILVCKANDETQGKQCDFVLWGKPLLDKCGECGWFLAEQKVRGSDRWRRYCSNPECVNAKGIAGETEEEEEEVAAE
jgi:DNA topoisomerase-1